MTLSPRITTSPIDCMSRGTSFIFASTTRISHAGNRPAGHGPVVKAVRLVLVLDGRLIVRRRWPPARFGQAVTAQYLAMKRTLHPVDQLRRRRRSADVDALAGSSNHIDRDPAHSAARWPSSAPATSRSLVLPESAGRRQVGSKRRTITCVMPHHGGGLRPAPAVGMKQRNGVQLDGVVSSD